MIDFIAGQQQRGEEHPDQHLFGPAAGVMNLRTALTVRLVTVVLRIALPFRFLEKRLQISGR